ncbi:MAG: tetratricopeptide repeat protein, partial [Planctomycetota bacterium]
SRKTVRRTHNRYLRNSRYPMTRARFTRLDILGLACLAWAASGGEIAWGLVGERLAGVDPPRVEWSVLIEPVRRAPIQEPQTLVAPSGQENRAYAPFASGWQFLQGELCPLEEGLFADAADGRWDEHALLGAALVASGVVDRDLLLNYQMQVAWLADELKQSGKMTGPPRQKAQALFEFLHRRVLVGGYRLDSTSLTLALDEGRYNCVSASVLFNCLAARFGLSAGGLEIPGHAMSRLALPDGTLNVETTCPGWFRLMDDPRKQAELVERTLGLRPGGGNASGEPREVTDVELVATIYYNRGVDLLGEKRFAEAVAANAKALRLDLASTTARGNLLATLNNWAIDLDTAGRHAEAIELLRRGIALDPEYETFRVNYVHVHFQWIEELCRENRFGEALDLIARALKDRVEEARFREVRLDVSRCWARSHPEPPATGRVGGASLGISGK